MLSGPTRSLTQWGTMESFNGPPLTTREALLQALFYDILRDCAPAGTIEHAVSELETLCYGRLSPEHVRYSNRHLAEYAGELAERLEKALGHKLQVHRPPSSAEEE